MENETKVCQDVLQQGEESGTSVKSSEDGAKIDETTIEVKNGSDDHKDLRENIDKDEITEENGSEIDEESEKTPSKKEDSHCGENSKFTIVHEEGMIEDENSTTECDFLDISSVILLRGTISELERALRDSRVLLETRDEDIASLRKEVEKSREQIHKEQMKWQRKSAVVEERGREIQELKRRLYDSEKANGDLQKRIKEFELPCSESDDVFSCCSSMKELIEIKTELARKNEALAEIRKNNCDDFVEGKALVAAKDGWTTEVNTSRTNTEECDRHNQLKLKFLRDAFFYFMIDFHSDEQIKAILAVLAYGDQREDVILQAYRMRQRGKKFSVKEVSSRGLSFLHEQM